VAAVREKKDPEQILGGAGSFTGLWALTWLGAQAVGVSSAVQGGFAVGGVMAGSGLTIMWWRLRALQQLDPEEQEREARRERSDAEF